MKKLNEGKTKIIWGVQKAGRVSIESKDDITAGDGAKHDVVIGKGALANQTTCNVFRLLEKCGVPVAFIEQTDETHFLAEKCAMLPFEVVVRREAHGSYRHRFPHIQKGHVFPRLILEFFAKTSGRMWDGKSIPMDDPFLDLSLENEVKFYIPHWTDEQKKEKEKTGFEGFLVGQKPFLKMPRGKFLAKTNCIESDMKYMGEIAIKTFLIIEKAWQLVGRKLVDFKVEFGRNAAGLLRLADVIDNDSWRVLKDGKHLDKQLYRDGAAPNEVTAAFQLVAELTGRFELPKQQIILWRASTGDDLQPFRDAIYGYGAESIYLHMATCSMHKEPVDGCHEITRLVQEIPDSVIIVFCGRSNGAGPTLSAQVTVPVITVPANWKEFPKDVWSSLRTPSEVPVATFLEPKNAVLLALQILATRNPWIYAELRIRQEKRLHNFMML